MWVKANFGSLGSTCGPKKVLEDTAPTHHSTLNYPSKGQNYGMSETPINERPKSTQFLDDISLERIEANDSPSKRARFWATIEQNWGCKPGDSVPSELIPRVRTGDGAFAPTNHPDKKRLSADKWSGKLVKALLHLSSVTVHDMKFAHKLLGERVRYRNNRSEMRDYWARELLSSDVEAVNTEVARLRSLGRYVGKSIMSLREVEMNGKWTEAPGHGAEGGDSENDDEGASIDSPPGEDAPWPELEDLIQAEEARMLQKAKEPWGYKENSAAS